MYIVYDSNAKVVAKNPTMGGIRADVKCPKSGKIEAFLRRTGKILVHDSEGEPQAAQKRTAKLVKY